MGWLNAIPFFDLLYVNSPPFLGKKLSFLLFYSLKGSHVKVRKFNFFDLCLTSNFYLPPSNL